MNLFEVFFTIFILAIVFGIVLYILSIFGSQANISFVKVLYSKLNYFLGIMLLAIMLFGLVISLVASYNNPSYALGIFDIMIIFFFGYIVINLGVFINAFSSFLSQLGLFYTLINNIGFYIFLLILFVLEAILNFRHGGGEYG
jgi:hypothetical protein